MSLTPFEIANLTSVFVQRRVETPLSDSIDIWLEAVYTSLFSVAFEVIVSLPQESEAHLERISDEILEKISHHSNEWISREIKKTPQYLSLPNFSIDFSERIKSRLVAYMVEAFTVMDVRGYDMNQARSHACFVVASQILTAMSYQMGGIDENDIKNILMNILEASDSLSNEIRGLLNKR